MNIEQLANNQVTVTTEKKGAYLQSYGSVVVFRTPQGAIEMVEIGIIIFTE